MTQMTPPTRPRMGTRTYLRQRQTNPAVGPGDGLSQWVSSVEHNTRPRTVHRRKHRGLTESNPRKRRNAAGESTRLELVPDRPDNLVAIT